MSAWYNLDYFGHDAKRRTVGGVFFINETIHLQYSLSAKYPLATISHLMEVLPPRLGLGYDIACSFWSTVIKSTIGAKARQQGLRMVVPAFHGHAHNRLCQLGFHIMNSPGFGSEDLETCERIFSSSNAVARLTCHATPFHRRQFFDLHFHHWDAEKYANLGEVSSLHSNISAHVRLISSISIQQLPAGIRGSPHHALPN